MRSAIILTAIASLALTTALPVGDATAAEHAVKMLNKGAKGGMVFEPDFVKAAPGDSIRFLPTDKGHNVESIKGMLPAGVAEFKSSMNVEYVLAPAAEGVYGVKCTPHYGMGMVALISVGSPTNAAEARAVKHPGKAGSRFEEIFEELE